MPDDVKYGGVSLSMRSSLSTEELERSLDTLRSTMRSSLSTEELERSLDTLRSTMSRSATPVLSGPLAPRATAPPVEYWPPCFARVVGEQTVVMKLTSQPRDKRNRKAARPRTREHLIDVAAAYFGRVLLRHGLMTVGEAEGVIQEEVVPIADTDGRLTGDLGRRIHYTIRATVAPIVGWAAEPAPADEEFIVLEMGKRP